ADRHVHSGAQDVRKDRKDSLGSSRILHGTNESQPASNREVNAGVQLEVMALCGTYHTISQVANVAQLPPEAFAARFPQHGPDTVVESGAQAGLAS
ncbi:MAG: hypothetical protein P1U65_17645, partial [Minwuia sp.]|nr:hypothetical protein [Minwuia sp.]